MLCFFRVRAISLGLNLVALILLAHSEGTQAIACECHLAKVKLGLAARFAVLATNTVTDTMDSKFNGDMGTSTGTTLPVYAPYTTGTGLNGILHPNDATAIAGRNAAISALMDIHLCDGPRWRCRAWRADFETWRLHVYEFIAG